MERMVRKKKTPNNGSGQPPLESAPEVEMPVASATIDVAPYIESDTEIMHKLQKLLNDAPRRPEFFRIEDAIIFADIYDRWYRRVTVELQ